MDNSIIIGNEEIDNEFFEEPNISVFSDVKEPVFLKVDTDINASETRSVSSSDSMEEIHIDDWEPKNKNVQPKIIQDKKIEQKIDQKKKIVNNKKYQNEEPRQGRYEEDRKKRNEQPEENDWNFLFNDKPSEQEEPIVQDDSDRESLGERLAENKPNVSPRFRNEEEEKLYYLIHLKNLEKKGAVLSTQYSTKSPVLSLKMEYTIQKDLIDREASVQSYKDHILFGVTTFEMLCGSKFNPTNVKMKGWSDNVSQNMDDFTPPLERLYEKYKDTGQSISPEMEISWVLAKSAFSFHMNSRLMDMGMPNLGNEISKDQDLMAGLFNAAMKAAGVSKEQQQVQQPVQQPVQMSEPKVNLNQLLSSFGLSNIQPLSQQSNVQQPNVQQIVQPATSQFFNPVQINNPEHVRDPQPQTEMEQLLKERENFDDTIENALNPPEIKTVSLGKTKGTKTKPGARVINI